MRSPWGGEELLAMFRKTDLAAAAVLAEPKATEAGPFVYERALWHRLPHPVDGGISHEGTKHRKAFAAWPMPALRPFERRC
jgi:hypothetical protein